MSNLKTVVYQRLEAIAAAEKITRVELREMSRELLLYVPDTDDIDIVNRLIGVLTPMNAKTCVLYFNHFLPWEVERDTNGVFVRFGKRSKGEKKVAKKLASITEWLADETNNVWTWADDNIELKKKDFARTISAAIKKSLAGDEKTDTDPLTIGQVLDAVFDGAQSGGVTLEEMLAAMVPAVDAKTQAMEEQRAAANADAEPIAA